jgi:hypothetical protein
VKKQNRIPLQALLQVTLCLGLIVVVFAVTFRDTTASGLGGQSQGGVSGLKTAIAGTADALLGPFPTSTLPTKTASFTATATPRISATPTMTASVTMTPSKTKVPPLTQTAEKRSSDLTATSKPTLFPTHINNPVASNTPVFFPSSTPLPNPSATSVQPTSIPPSNTPVIPTNTKPSSTPRPSRTPRPTFTSQPSNTPVPPSATNPPPQDTPTDPPATSYP